MADFVYMSHPDTEAIGGPVSRAAFDHLWSKKGWEEVEAPVPDEEAQLDPQYDRNQEAARAAAAEKMAAQEAEAEERRQQLLAEAAATADSTPDDDNDEEDQ